MTLPAPNQPYAKDQRYTKHSQPFPSLFFSIPPHLFLSLSFSFPFQPSLPFSFPLPFLSLSSLQFTQSIPQVGQPTRGALTMADVITTITSEVIGVNKVQMKKTKGTSAIPRNLPPPGPPLVRSEEAFIHLTTLIQSARLLEISLDRLVSRRKLRNFQFCLRFIDAAIAGASPTSSDAPVATIEIENGLQSKRELELLVAALETIRFFILPPGLIVDDQDLSAFEHNADIFIQNDGFTKLLSLCKVGGLKLQNYILRDLLAELPPNVSKHPDGSPRVYHIDCPLMANTGL